MGVFVNSPALYTDMYQLIMAQGYLQHNLHYKPVTFDYFYRKNPFDGGYVVFAGMADFLDVLENLRFTEEDIDYLFGLDKFSPSFLDYLRNFRFLGNIHSVREGEVVFPNEPTIRVEGGWLECQLLETLLLNIVNFQSLIATKASRLRRAAGKKPIIDMGLRRAQSIGGIHASRAAIIGGVTSTSNVNAARYYDLTPVGTMAHSWIQGFDTELAAFRAFTEVYPDNSVLLVDTYSTLKSGVPNAIRIAKELESKGKRLVGIRLDSGDFAYLSKKTRAMLDEASLQYVKIVVSNQLDEYVIQSLENQKAPIDVFGVGTNLAVAAGSPAHDGVYKLSSAGEQLKMKFSDNIGKQTLPGPKDIYRFMADTCFYADGIVHAGTGAPRTIINPQDPTQQSSVWQLAQYPLLRQVVKTGKVLTGVRQTVAQATTLAREQLAFLEDEVKRFENPHLYKVGVSGGLLRDRDAMVKAYKPV
jgi:nicotinate phosphoribosyltransferase